MATSASTDGHSFRVLRHLASDLGASVPSQLLAQQLLPSLPTIAATRRERLARSVGDALAQLRQTIPEVRIDAPDGGSILWAKLPIADVGPLVDVARQHGVRIAPGHIHFSDKAPGPFLRIDVDRSAHTVREGIRRLGHAWQEIHGEIARPITM